MFLVLGRLNCEFRVELLARTVLKSLKQLLRMFSQNNPKM